MARCIAEPLSRKDIRKTAELIRKIDGSENDMFFDIVRFLEIKLPSIDSNFNFRVLPQDEMGGCHGITYPDRNEIQIRQDVYDRAIAGSGRDRLTLAHELGHLLFHEKQNISYARVGDNTGIVVFRDPEWQADAFGGEVLMLKEVIKGHNVKEVMNLCKVSEKAALCQLSK